MRIRTTAGPVITFVAGGIMQIITSSAVNVAATVPEQKDSRGAAVTTKEIRFFYDPKPERGVPPEARDAGTVADEKDQPPENKSNIGFRIVRDLKEYGPLRNVIRGPVAAVRIRYFDNAVIDRIRAESFIKVLLTSESGSTHSFVFWAEALGVPIIEAYVHIHDTPTPGYLLVWSGRAVYRDPLGKWWFTASPIIGARR